MKKILIIEDEEVIALSLEILFTSKGLEVIGCVNNYTDTIKKIQENKPDIIISDIMLKGSISGCELAKEINFNYHIPLIFLSAYYNEEILEHALEANAYAYLLKPINTNELIATVKLALNNNSCHIKNSPIIQFDTFTYNKQSKEVIQNNKPIKLGKKSLLLLDFLINNLNQSIPNETIIDYVYNEDIPQNIDNLRHLIKRTRAKLNTNVILSNKNIGYGIYNSSVK